MSQQQQSSTTPQGLKGLLGAKALKGKGGVDIEVDSLENAELIGIYFSAHWCPPCRGFTPMLAECYNKINAEVKKFEIVFVSSDRDEGAFNDYFGEMPWLALPFSEREQKDQLSQKYGVRGIPTLVLVKSNGDLVSTEGRAKVMSDQEGEKFPWSQ